MAAKRVAVLLMLCLLLTGTANGRKGKLNNNNNYECTTGHLCECEEKEIDVYEKCYGELDEATIDYAVGKVKNLELCKGFNGKIEKMPFKEYVAAYCALPPDEQKECYDDLNREIMMRMKNMALSFNDGESQKEREGLENCGYCLQPPIMSCRDSLSKCL